MENLIKKHNERMKQLDLSIVSGSLSDDDAALIIQNVLDSLVEVGNNIMNWIDINETTPEQRENPKSNILCFGVKYGNTYKAQYVNGRFKFKDGSQGESDTITHWMDMPLPPLNPFLLLSTLDDDVYETIIKARSYMDAKALFQDEFPQGFYDTIESVEILDKQKCKGETISNEDGETGNLLEELDAITTRKIFASQIFNLIV